MRCHLNRDWRDAVRRIAVRPLNGLGVFVVEPDVAHDFSGQIGFGGKDATGDEIALDFGEPDFDLVEPGGISRSGVDTQARVFGQEGGNGLGFVSREVSTIA